MLVHADAKSMILASTRKVFALEWAPGGAEPTPTWRSDIGSSEIRGRPFLTRGALLVPTVAKLFGIKPSGGLVAFTTPASPKVWENLEGQGNVIAVGDQLVIATSERVEIYTDFDKAQAKYADSIKQRPEDVETRLTWAEILFNSGRLAESTTTLDEAAALAKTPMGDRRSSRPHRG